MVGIIENSGNIERARGRHLAARRGNVRSPPLAVAGRSRQTCGSTGGDDAMLAFEVRIDGERLCLAGMEDWSVLAAHVTAVRRRNADSEPQDELEFAVGGLTQADRDDVSHHARWACRPLQVGSQVEIAIVDTDRPDEPNRRYRSDRDVQESPFTDEEIEEMERAEWLRLKAKFEAQGGASPP